MCERIPSPTLREFYAARLAGDLDEVCRIFADDAEFEISGASQSDPIAISATGVSQIRTWLALLIKTSRLTDHAIVSMVTEDTRAAVRWRAKLRSKITGVAVTTDFIDLVEIRDGRIVSYTEFFVPR